MDQFRFDSENADTKDGLHFIKTVVNKMKNVSVGDNVDKAQ